MRTEAHELVVCVSCGVVLHYDIVANQETQGELIICPVCKKVLREKP